MAWFTRSSRLTLLAVALIIGLAVNVTAQAPTPLASPSLGSRLPQEWEFRSPNAPGRNAPVNREGGATRSPCVKSERPLTAMVPASGTGTTGAGYPTVFWYMPETSASGVEFVLKDANDQVVYSVKYALAQSTEDNVSLPGIMSLTLPAFANLSPLEIDQEYQWQLSLICQPLDRSADVIVGGKIKRVKLGSTLAVRTQQANPQDLVALYADARVWYETLATLVALRRERPQDPELAEAWNKLIDSVELRTTYEEPWFQVQKTLTNNKK